MNLSLKSRVEEMETIIIDVWEKEEGNATNRRCVATHLLHDSVRA